MWCDSLKRLKVHCSLLKRHIWRCLELTCSSELRNYSWWCWGIIGDVRNGTTCKSSTLPVVLSLWAPFCFFCVLFLFFQLGHTWWCSVISPDRLRRRNGWTICGARMGWVQDKGHLWCTIALTPIFCFPLSSKTMAHTKIPNNSNRIIWSDGRWDTKRQRKRKIRKEAKELSRKGEREKKKKNNNPILYRERKGEKKKKEQRERHYRLLRVSQHFKAEA